MSDVPVAAPKTDDIFGKIFDKDKTDYVPVLNNWYTSKPYGFLFTPSQGNPITMYLPINPQNLNIVTHFATNLIPTIYGTVEEHSPVRYYDIQIEGTTGISPKFVDPSESIPVISKGRSTFVVQQNLGTGLLTKTVNTFQNIFNDASALINGGKPSTPKTGLKLDQTGYAAFHNLYRFLLAYKKDVTAAKVPRDDNKDSPLIFFNYKDGNRYSVVVKSFTLRRDKENPMLYYYSIVMRGYNLKSSDDSKAPSPDTTNTLESLGLAGVKGSTILGDVKNAASYAKDIVASVTNGVSQLGR